MYGWYFILLCSTVMTYYIAGSQRNMEDLLQITSDLADSNYPHQMPEVFEVAREQISAFPDMIEDDRRGLKRRKNLAYFDMTSTGLRRAVNTVLGMSGMDIALTCRVKLHYDCDGDMDLEGGHYAVSVRGSKGCGAHPGRLVSADASEVGGSGGGHARACSAIIPFGKINAFVSELDRRAGMKRITAVGARCHDQV